MGDGRLLLCFSVEGFWSKSDREIPPSNVFRRFLDLSYCCCSVVDVSLLTWRPIISFVSRLLFHLFCPSEREFFFSVVERPEASCTRFESMIVISTDRSFLHFPQEWSSNRDEDSLINKILSSEALSLTLRWCYPDFLGRSELLRNTIRCLG